MMEKPSVLIAPEMTVSYQCESIETESVTVPFTSWVISGENKEVLICL